MAVIAKKTELRDDIIQRIKEAVREGSNSSDDLLESLYEEKSKKLSYRHFTPCHIVQKAISYLVQDEKDLILDIGSGNGKFCHVGALMTEAQFVGVEFKRDLFDEACRIKSLLNCKNATFHCDNILNWDFNQFTGIYLFNPFLEQIDVSAKMDDSSELNLKNYQQYVDHVKFQLSTMQSLARLVTYYYKDSLVPDGFVCKQSHYGGTLKCYMKES